MPNEAELLFVYGTLRPTLAAGGHARLVRDLEVVGPATVPGLLLDLGDYPGLIEGAGIVHGELLRVSDPARLEAFDAYEECNGPEPLFRRERAVARLGDATTVEAWVYRFARPTEDARIIAGGDYAAHLPRH
ncbi:MAG: gamma-glutamylcyclotransferase [Planctomycetota bacterium]